VVITPALTALKPSNSEGRTIAPRAEPRKHSPPNSPPYVNPTASGRPLCINMVDAIPPNITDIEAMAKPTHQFFNIPILKEPLKDLLL